MGQGTLQCRARKVHHHWDVFIIFVISQYFKTNRRNSETYFTMGKFKAFLHEVLASVDRVYLVAIQVYGKRNDKTATARHWITVTGKNELNMLKTYSAEGDEDREDQSSSPTIILQLDQGDTVRVEPNSWEQGSEVDGGENGEGEVEVKNWFSVALLYTI